ncbi:hypothetical protein [Pseudomonas sp. RW10S2]|uniref:hypothetical protein n=1 Tax=Pseudomonas sp. RW10S2 TaxID=459637 RepID=UPI001645C944|nr:hypothetical protein [Pseudomonas sp. RW10S2]MBC3468212.1 hypothetical protein [Pseudomonas sp. RW10S2]
MMKSLDQMKADMTTTSDVGRALLAGSLVEVVERSKVRNSLLHALGGIERQVWVDLLRVAEARADTFASSALQYGDLSQAEYDELAEHIRKRVTARHALLKERFGSQQPIFDTDQWYYMGRAAFNAGQPLSMCTSHPVEAAFQWSKGWRAAQADNLTEGGY